MRSALGAGLGAVLVTESSYTAGQDFSGAALVLDQLGEPGVPGAGPRRGRGRSGCPGSHRPRRPWIGCSGTSTRARRLMPRPLAPAARAAEVEPFHVMRILARARELEAQGRDIVHMEVGLDRRSRGLRSGTGPNRSEPVPCRPDACPACGLGGVRAGYPGGAGRPQGRISAASELPGGRIGWTGPGHRGTTRRGLLRLRRQRRRVARQRDPCPGLA